MSFCLSMLFALCLDRLIGWPDGLYQRLSHPVVGIGRLISWCDAKLNRTAYASQRRKIGGIITVVIVIMVTGFASFAVTAFLPSGVMGIILTALIAWPFLAAKSLYDHVLAVAKPLAKDELGEARLAVSMIVGRNPEQLDKTAIARASLESLAENTSDGVTAPLFWGSLFGLPGLVIYKAINTMDSMIGYKNETYQDFGWAAARFDDLVNLIPARLTGCIYALLSGRPAYAMRVMIRDAARHRSPNAGWPETALAAALDIRLSGPRAYDGVMRDEAWLHPEGRDPEAQDIAAGLSRFTHLLWVVSGLMLLGAGICLQFGIGTFGQ